MRRCASLVAVALSLALVVAMPAVAGAKAKPHKPKPKHHATTTTKPKSKTKSTKAALGETVSATFAGTAHPTFTPGKAGSLDVIFIGKPVDSTFGSSKVPVEIWNGTNTTIFTPSVGGSATSDGTVDNTGDGMDVEPGVMAPGAVGFGIVYFHETLPATATFQFTTSGVGKGAFTTLNVKVVTASLGTTPYGKQIVGTISNTSSTTLAPPVETDAYCFTGGTLIDVSSSEVTGTAPVPPGGTGSFAIPLDTTVSCATYLVGSFDLGQ